MRRLQLGLAIALCFLTMCAFAKHHQLPTFTCPTMWLEEQQKWVAMETKELQQVPGYLAGKVKHTAIRLDYLATQMVICVPPEPCQNGGYRTGEGYNYRCVCPGRSTGKHCEYCTRKMGSKTNGGNYASLLKPVATRWTAFKITANGTNYFARVEGKDKTEEFSARIFICLNGHRFFVQSCVHKSKSRTVGCDYSSSYSNPSLCDPQNPLVFWINTGIGYFHIGVEGDRAPFVTADDPRLTHPVTHIFPGIFGMSNSLEIKVTGTCKD